MFSIVCVYNNKRIFDGLLFNSLNNQAASYELIRIENANGVFKSAAQALNYGGNMASGKYIMFVHQDVSLESTTWLEEAEKVLDSLTNIGIAGIAGMSTDANSNHARGRNIISHGPDRRKWEAGHFIGSPEIVQTLDCCLLIIPKGVFDSLKFDESTCDDWHLYGEDYCLSSTLKGLNSYVLPLSIYHASMGVRSLNRLKILLQLGANPKEYYRTLKKVIKKHRQDYKYIYTSGGEWNTYQPLIWQRIIMIAVAARDLIVNKFRLYVRVKENQVRS